MLTQTVDRRRTEPTSSRDISTLLTRVRSEYLEMPGLNLTEAQARRLWALDRDTCRVVLATLIKRGFLRRSPRGTYLRAGT
jgi:predicted transcriptional regulator of viral defense system